VPLDKTDHFGGEDIIRVFAAHNSSVSDLKQIGLWYLSLKTSAAIDADLTPDSIVAEVKRAVCDPSVLSTGWSYVIGLISTFSRAACTMSAVSKG